MMIWGSGKTITAGLWLDVKRKITQILSINRYTLAGHMTFMKKLQAGSDQRQTHTCQEQNLPVCCFAPFPPMLQTFTLSPHTHMPAPPLTDF